MHRSKRLAILLAVSLFMGSTVGTSAMAAETAEEVTSVATEEDASSEAGEEDTSSQVSEEDESEAAVVEETEVTAPNDKEEETEAGQEVVSDGGEAADDNEDAVDIQDEKGDEEILEETDTESQDKTEEDIPAEEPVVESEADTQEVSNEAALATSSYLSDETIGEGYLDATEMFVGDELAIHLDSNYLYYKFTPEEDGIYTFVVYNQGPMDPNACLYNDDLELIATNGGDINYELINITERLEASRTYYLRVRADRGDGDRTLQLKRTSFYARAAKNYFYSSYGEEITLSVVAISDNTVEYQWYDDYHNLIEGEESADYTFAPNKLGYYEYTCEVTDGIENITIGFNLEIINRVHAEAVCESFDVSPGEEVTLEVNAYTDDGSAPIYEWRKGYYTVIEGETGNSLTVTADGNSEYCCKVYTSGSPASPGSDEGSSEYLYFYIHVNNQLVVYPEGAGEDSNGNKLKEVTCNVNGSDPITLRVIAVALDTEGLEFTWDKEIVSSSGWPNTVYERLDADGDSIVVSEPKTGLYTCWVSDRFGNGERVYFHLVGNSGNNLSVYPEGAGMTHGKTDKYAYIPYQTSGTVTLRPIVSADDTDGMNYEWYEWTYDLGFWDKTEQYDGQSEITVDYVDYTKMFKCVVTDQYGNHDYAIFEIVKNNLRVSSANGEVEHEGGNNSRITVVKSKGEDLTLKTIVTADDTSNIEYNWWLTVDDFQVNNLSDTDTCVVTREYAARYTCEVKDGYDNRFLMQYYVITGCEEHTYGDWTITKEPTCTEEGSQERVCTVCGAKETEVIPAKGHVWEEEYRVDIEATCVDEGYESIHCSVCHESNPDTVRVIERKAHDFSDWKVIEEPTCTRDGSQERVCNNCGYKETETIPAPGHKWDTEYTVDQEPTCTHVGYESIHCTICHIFDEGTVREIPKKEHTCEEWTVTKEATCTEDGSREGVCEYCGTEMTETIPSTGHIWNDYYTRDVEPTETEEGSESKHCSVCDAIDESTVRPIPVLVGKWMQDRNGWWYDRGNGTYPKDGFEEIKGVTYYFDASGYMKTGWVKDDGDWYYFAASGAMVKDNWQQSGSTWYYFGEDGKMLTGLQEINGTSYFFEASGAMATGWQQIDGDWYFFNAGGAMVKGNWQQSGSTWYYFGEDGKMLTGLQEVNGTSYFFKDSGAMATGWQQLDGTWYYFNAGGAMVHGWQKIGNVWYYFGDEGEMYTGLQDIGDATYYFNASGAMLTGWQKIDEAWCYFEASGAMVRSRWVGDYYLDEYGEMATDRWIGEYYVGPDGKWVPGMEKVN